MTEQAFPLLLRFVPSQTDEHQAFSSLAAANVSNR
jgi:hypothetical protein